MKRGRLPKSAYVDGVDGDEVACSVKANGAAFDVTLDATGHALNSNQQPALPTVVHIRIPSIENGVSSASGTIAVQDSASLVTYVSNQVCFLDARRLDGCCRTPAFGAVCNARI